MDGADAQLEAGGQSPEGTDEVDGEGTDGPKYKGFQARVDELTREKHETRRELEAAKAREAAMMAMIGRIEESRATGPVIQGPPPPELDSDVKRAIEAMLAPHISRLEQATRAAAETATLSRTDQLLAGCNPWVQQRARQLLPRGRELNVPIEDVIKFAKGDYLDALERGEVEQPKTRAPNGQFSGPGVMTQVGSPQTLQLQGPKPLPANFEQLTVREKLALLEKRGAADKPL